MDDLRGTLRQKQKGGLYYYRLTVANGLRKEFSLKTADYEEARQKALDLDAVWEAPTHEVAIAQINAIKGFSKQAQNLPFSEVWRRYELHTDCAMPHTVSEQLSYHIRKSDLEKNIAVARWAHVVACYRTKKHRFAKILLIIVLIN